MAEEGDRPEGGPVGPGGGGGEAPPLMGYGLPSADCLHYRPRRKDREPTPRARAPECRDEFNGLE